MKENLTQSQQNLQKHYEVDIFNRINEQSICTYEVDMKNEEQAISFLK